MKKPFLLLLLAIAATVTVVSRAVTNNAPTSAANVQYSLTTPILGPSTRPELRLLPESVRKRKIKTLDNNSFRLEDFAGKIIVINLWASWCGACSREIPEYEEVRKSYVGQDVEFIGLTTDDPRTSSNQVARFLRDISFGFRLGWADRDTARTLMNGKRALPQTLVIDTDGRILNQWAGYSPGESGNRLNETIQQAIAVRTVPR